ncbi:hypothetical protein BBBGCB_BBBGCB_14870, partial [Dysosmobacter welbionis]
DHQPVHKALHNGEAHTAALLPAGGEHGLAGLLDVRDAPAVVPHRHLQHLVRADADFHHHLADGIRIGVD